MEAAGTVGPMETSEGKPKVSGWMWAALAAGGGVLALLVVQRLAKRPCPTLGDVIADGLAEAWSSQLDAPQGHIRLALQGRDSALLDRIRHLVGKVSCTFRQESDAEQRHLVAVVLGCDYRDGGSAEVRMRIPWRRVPAGVRDELLQASAGEVARTWPVG